MTRTPFSRYTNAYIVFKLDVGVFRVDERTGNEVSVPEERTIQAMVARPERQNIPDETQGPDREVIRLRGRLTNPKFLPNWVRPGSRAVMTIVDRAAGAEQSGNFTFTSVQQAEFPQITRALGSIFEGDFKVERDGETVYAS